MYTYIFHIKLESGETTKVDVMARNMPEACQKVTCKNTFAITRKGYRVVRDA